MFEEIKQIEKQGFLNTYIENGNITDSCKIAKVGRTTCWLWRKQDEEFNKACKVAEEVYKGNYLNELEQELKKRSLDKTAPMSTVALFFALKAESPEKYREKAPEFAIKDITVKLEIPQREYPQLDTVTVIDIEEENVQEQGETAGSSQEGSREA